MALVEAEFKDVVHTDAWELRMQADGEAYAADKQRKLLSKETTDELRALMATHAKAASSADAAAAGTNVRGSAAAYEARLAVKARL